MDFRKTFDKIPENFDKYRPRYCRELFREIISQCHLNSDKEVLEIGPGTGQATEPILKSGCNYTAIELGSNFTALMQDKFNHYPNFHIINADFETYPFKNNTYDLIYSAATIQWIPEKTAFSKTFQMLKPGGYLAMFMTRSDEKSSNEELWKEIHIAYEKYFHVSQTYNCKMDYLNAANYGFTNFTYKEWHTRRILNTDEYIAYISTHCEHITLEEPYRSNFFAGVRNAVSNAGGQITILDTIPLYLFQKPC